MSLQCDHSFEITGILLIPIDLRDPSTTPLNFTRSINLALSERGINAMRESRRPTLLEKVMAGTIYMRGRMIHGKSASGEFTNDAQDYDVHGRVSVPKILCKVDAITDM
jgi:hypothetical protein